MEKFSVSGQLVDITNKKIYAVQIDIVAGRIEKVTKIDNAPNQYILPGFIDAHVHIESSMLIPTEFANLAMTHGTVGTISDPHEIANVLGIEGVEFMINNASKSPLHILFGVPSCVPATSFETAGADLDPGDVRYLFEKHNLKYLSEMMNYPGVIYKDAMIMDKIGIAKELNKPIDGHAPGLMGKDADTYFGVGISTDHECFSYEEGLYKSKLGVKILIREGSAAKNYKALAPLFKVCPDQLMFCSDDKHPDDLILGHINQLVSRAIEDGYDLFDVLSAACINPVQHYDMPVGLVRVGDSADFIISDDLKTFEKPEVYIKGVRVASQGIAYTMDVEEKPINKFSCQPIKKEDIIVPRNGQELRVIKAIDGELITQSELFHIKDDSPFVSSNIEEDILKMVVYNRYSNAAPAVAFINGFGLKKGAIASTVAHDCHNIIAVGADDDSLVKTINTLIENKGGIVAVTDSETKKLALPVAGLMSFDDGVTVGTRYKEIDQFVKENLGSTLTAPFMTLSFMALLVIPSLKLSDKGLFDGNSFNFVELMH